MKTHHGFCKTIIFGIFAFSFCVFLFWETLLAIKKKWLQKGVGRPNGSTWCGPHVAATLRALGCLLRESWLLTPLTTILVPYMYKRQISFSSRDMPLLPKNRSLSPTQRCLSCQVTYLPLAWLRTNLFLQHREISLANWQISVLPADRFLFPTDRFLSYSPSCMDGWMGWVGDGWLLDGWWMVDNECMMNDGWWILRDW